MPIRYTRHALDRLGDRGIAPAWVEHTLAAPEINAPDPKNVPHWHAFRRIAEKGQRWLRVVYVPLASGPLVITAFFDRGQQRKARSGP